MVVEGGVISMVVDPSVESLLHLHLETLYIMKNSAISTKVTPSSTN